MGVIKTPKEVQALREGGVILAEAVEETLAAVRPGITTDELNRVFVAALTRHGGAEPSFLGYKGYTKSICTSVNNEVVHGIPGSRVLQEGDIIGVDCGVRYKGFCTDMARTVGVGAISEKAQQLIDVTRQSLEHALAVMKPGNTIGDIGAAVQHTVEKAGYSVVRALVGHGVGESVHEEPQVPNYGRAGSGLQLEAGMVLAVEPMVNEGHYDVVFENDGWTVSTNDGTLSAHFEDTIAIGAEGPEVLTRLQ